MAKTQTKPPTLTWLQQAFVQAYVGKAQGNATEAARLAGYSPNSSNALSVIGKKNLALGHVWSAIQSEKERLQANTGIDAQWCLEQAAEQYRVCCADADRANARGYLDMVSKIVGAYDRPEQGRDSSAPTIVINMPELPGVSRPQPMLEGEIVDDAEEPAGVA